MVWLFERPQGSAHKETMRLETKYDGSTKEFVLLIVAGGQEKTERFADEETFRVCLQALETQLHIDGWKQGATMLLRDGWKVG